MKTVVQHTKQLGYSWCMKYEFPVTSCKFQNTECPKWMDALFETLFLSNEM